MSSDISSGSAGDMKKVLSFLLAIYCNGDFTGLGMCLGTSWAVLAKKLLKEFATIIGSVVRLPF